MVVDDEDGDIRLVKCHNEDTMKSLGVDDGQRFVIEVRAEEEEEEEEQSENWHQHVRRSLTRMILYTRLYPRSLMRRLIFVVHLIIHHSIILHYPSIIYHDLCLALICSVI